jgi:hypothetical protein
MLKGARAAVLVLLLLGPAACAGRVEVNGERALARVVHQVEAGPRVPGTPGHSAVRGWLKQQLDSLGGRVEEQVFVDTTLKRPLELHNIIAHFGRATGKRIALCAHWDTRPWCDQDPDSAQRDRPVPGANDGGSGVAVLLEVAEVMSRRAPPLGVDLVFFDGEDQGQATRADQFCLGAKGYAALLESSPNPAARPVAAFVFDMVGDRDLDIYPEAQSARRAANLVRIVLDAARATSARHFHDRPRYELVDDHVRLLEVGIPAVDIIDFDYEVWHTHLDLPDRVSAASLAEVARVATWIVYRSPLSVNGRAAE